MTPTQTQLPCKQLLQPLFGGRFLIQQLTPGRQANLGLRLYNRPSAVASPHRPPSIGLRIHIVRHPSVCPIGAIHRHRRNPIRTKRQRRAHRASAGTIYMRFGDALLRRPRKRSRLQLTPDRVGGTRTDAYAPRSAAAERSIAKCRKLGRR